MNEPQIATPATPETQQKFVTDFDNLINDAIKTGIPLGLMISKLSIASMSIVFQQLNYQQMMQMQSEMQKQGDKAKESNVVEMN